MKRAYCPSAKHLMVFTLTSMLLTGCDGFEAASKATRRAAYRANFIQLPFVESNVSEGRVLTMHIFSGAPGGGSRVSKEFRFSAKLTP